MILRSQLYAWFAWRVRGARRSASPAAIATLKHSVRSSFHFRRVRRNRGMFRGTPGNTRPRRWTFQVPVQGWSDWTSLLRIRRVSTTPLSIAGRAGIFTPSPNATALYHTGFPGVFAT